MNRLFSTTLIVGTLLGCNRQESFVGEPIRLLWGEGETFHVAAVYRLGAVKSEENPVSIEDAEPVVSDIFDERWSDELVWTYQVVESGFTPSASDELYDYSLTGTGEQTSIAVIKVILDPTLNLDPEMLEADPVTYLIFREDNDRLTGVISFTNIDGERVEQAYSSGNTGRSWSVLSQSSLTKVPTYLAPYSTAWTDGERKTENGGNVSSTLVDDWTVDVVYNDEMDEGSISSRYEAGQPWPTWTVAENTEAWLLSEDDVRSRRGGTPYFLPADVEDFDYRAALASSLDLDKALVLDSDTIEGEGFDAEVREEFRPWAGNWWPLTKGDLVFGSYGGSCSEEHCTISSLIREEADELKHEMDDLSAEIRKLEDGDEKSEKIASYKENQKELVDLLVDFYKGILQGLDGGQITIDSGKIKHSQDGWEFDLEALSPMDKFSTVQYLRGKTNPNPYYLGAWEILNSYNPGGESWWGHCNGWAAAAILTNEPRESMNFSVSGEDIEFTVADMKGLLTESHYSTYSRFYGERYNGDDEDDIKDLTPASFQKIMNFYVREQGVPLVFDTTATEAVWNFPAYGIELTLTETTSEDIDSLINVNTASMFALQELPDVDEDLAADIVEYREDNGPFQSIEELKDVSGIGAATYKDIADRVTVDPIERTFDARALVTLTTDSVDEDHVDGPLPESFTKTWDYTLVTNKDGVVLRGEWDDDENHPDFAWVPYSNPHEATRGNSENPYLNYGHLLDILGDEVERK
jgi:competence ComEA-like helix-hairpin-helix protein